MDSHYIEIFKSHLLPPLGTMLRNRDLSVVERCKQIKHLADGSLALAGSGAEWSAALLRTGEEDDTSSVSSTSKLVVNQKSQILQRRRRGGARFGRQRYPCVKNTRVTKDLRERRRIGLRRFMEDQVIESRFKALQGLVPGGDRMNCSVLLDEAADYMMFLKFQVGVLQSLAAAIDNTHHYHQTGAATQDNNTDL